MPWIKMSEAIRQIPDLILSGNFKNDFDRIPMISKELSWRQRSSLIRCGISYFSRSRYSSLPPIIQIEPTNFCNLKCPLCPSGEGGSKRKKGFMSMNTFQRIMDELGDGLIQVILYGWGEPFLSQNMPDMIALCTKRNIQTVTSSNGHGIQDLDKALKIVDAGLKGLIIAFDGITQEHYEAYRKQGKMEKVIRFVTLIEKAKEIRKSQYPYTNLRIVINKENRSDIPGAQKMAKDLGVNLFSYRSLACITNEDQYIDYEPDETELQSYQLKKDKKLEVPFLKCTFPFRQPTIFWDGTVVGCEQDYDLDAPWGNIHHENFKEIWETSVASQLRRSITNNGQDPTPFCRRCPYQGRSTNSFIVGFRELRPIQS